MDANHVFIRFPIFTEKKEIFNKKKTLITRKDIFPYIILGVDPVEILDSTNTFRLPKVPGNYHEVLAFLKERDILITDEGKHKGRDTFVEGVQLHCVKILVRLDG